MIFPLAPWPCGNLSLALETERVAEDVRERAQEIFSWWGTTIHIPGETEIHVVLPRTTYLDTHGAEVLPVLVVPTFGHTAVGPYQPYDKIPINRQWVPLADYLVSCVNDVNPA